MKLSTSTTHPERRSRFARVPAFALAAVLAAAGMAVAPGVAQASTTKTLPPQTFTAAGIYPVTVPGNATSVHLVGLGGAGRNGGTAPSDYGAGGAGGHGTQASEDVPIGPAEPIAPGSTLTVRVGAVGGGGPGGAPQYAFGNAAEGGVGGAGGGATTIADADGTLLVIAGGGGGGGGGGNGGNGGNGGTLQAGQATFVDGVVAARGGATGAACSAPFQLQLGDAGESDGTTFNLGGGGGGGGQGCSGGGGGGSGDHGAGRSSDGAPGGGGGAGGTSASGGSNVAFAAGTNTGDGSASITFTVAVPGPGDGPYSTTVTLNPDPLRLGDDATVSISPILDVTGAPVTDTSAVNIEVLGPDGLARGRCYDIVSPCVFHSGWLGLQDRENTAGVYEAVVWYYPPPHNYELRIATQPFLVLPALLPTTTALSTPAPLTGSGGTLFATVTPTSSNPLIPTGTVSFTDGTTPLCGGPVDHPAETPDGKGVVYDCRLDAVTPGPHHYSATYSGDDHFAGSAGALDSMVPPAAVATSITLASAPNPAPAGQQVTFTVSVGPAGTTTLTGTVTFTDGSTPLAVEPLASDGTAAYTTDTLPVGPHQITATYSGDGSHTGASSSALTESITPPPTAPLAITTTGSLPGGTVGSQYSATLTASGGTSPYQWDLAPGSALPTGLTLHSDGRIDGTPTAASTGVVTVQVTDSARPAQASLARLNLAVAAAPTSTSLSSSADPALRGQPITFTARVTAPAGAPVPAGRVTFSDGATSRATVKLNEDGVATYTTRSLAVGSHPLTATYAGDAADLGSTSAPLPEVVQRVTAAALAAQATTDVQASHAYARLTPARRRAVLAQVNRTTQPLAVLSGRSRAAQKAALIRAFDSAVRVAERRRYLTPAQAAALIDEAATL